MKAFTNVHLPDGGSANVMIGGERIAAIGGDIPAGAETIDGQGKLLAPGIVDLGVFRVDGPAFRFGGIVRAALMPDQSPPLDDPGLIQRAAYSGKPDIWVHPLAAATRGLKGEELAEFGLMQAAGAKAVATGRRWIADSGVMLRVMRYAAAFDLTVVSHAEDSGLTGSAVATAGETATRLGLPAAPAEAEAMAIARDLALAEISGARLHVRQVTTAAGFDLIRAAKVRGLPVTCGITPAHLLLSDLAVSDFRTFAHLSPPLRSEADRHAALEAVRDGTIDVIASGHDPRGPEDKRLPFADSAAGAAGAETLLALSLNLVRDGVIALERLFELIAANPSRLLGLEGGRLEPGAPADLILVDQDAPWRVDSGRMRAAAGNTPFDKLPVQGRVLRLFKDGREIA
ncbi:amidohydrolase family protein [Sphingomonas sp. MAH-20]|uniref:Amidohydrolase family protein n=1 Tax=Sphingomonas horti TaxID=2682842 RepID=A0A6I4J2Q2_9SPHN|nr:MULTISPECIES: dihydroorotase [Sphingomonas]MBA2918565.1 amidohydrolase family protein [Sphingomonas sp. CGMCC 1.13658]MVO78596.1 amidohydrolase family protein [Sphingomonas horti]